MKIPNYGSVNSDLVYGVDHMSVMFSASESGGWFIERLVWKDCVVVGDGSRLLAAGWELNLDGKRFTPHLSGVCARDFQEERADDGVRYVFPHDLDNLARLDMEIRIDHERPLLWQRIRITNTSSRPLLLDRMNFAQIKLTSAFCQAIQTKTHYASRDADSSVAPLGIDDPAFALHDPRLGLGLLVGSLAPGLLRRFSPGMYVSVGYSNGEVRFEETLLPGESFESDWAFFLFYDTDPREASHWLVQRRLRRRPFVPPLTYCSWVPFLADINEEKVTTQIEQAGKLGFEVFLIDDGWQNRSGDWEVHSGKFPNGLEPLAAQAAENEMQLGLWIGLNTAHQDSKVVHNHPEWLLRHFDGTPVYTNVGEGRMNLFCLDSGYGDWIQDKIIALVSRYGLRYLKIDLPMVQDVYFEPPISCHCPSHGHRTPHGYPLRAYRRLQALCETIRQRFPSLILDLTFELWGSFHAIDYALVQCADVTWAANLVDTPEFPSKAPREARHLIEARSALFPAVHFLPGNLRCDSFCFRESVDVALTGYPCMLGDLAKLDTIQQDFIRDRFERYKWERRLPEISNQRIRKGRYHHGELS